MNALVKIAHTGPHIKRFPCACSFFPNPYARVLPSFSAAVRTVATFVPKKSHYEVLGLSQTATTKEIRLAFIRLSKQCHPDSNRDDPNNHKKFVQVNEAYSILIKPQSRRDYDSTLRAERYVARHMNASAYRSHTYTHRPDMEHDYHFHRYNDAYRMKDNHTKESPNEKNFLNFYVLTVALTFTTVTAILHYMYNYIPDIHAHKFRQNITSSELEQHELIMSSEHEGMTVYYYAVPSEDDPDKFEVLAVSQNQAKDSSTPEIQKLNSVRYRSSNLQQER